MYVPKAFAVADETQLREFMRAHDFALVTSCGGQGLMATHVPVLVDAERGAKGTIVAHFARANRHWLDLQGTEALVVFSGPHGYVSPRWYETTPAVPTWNYAAVHAYGTARALFDAGELRDIVARLSQRHEAGAAKPWTLEHAGEDYIQGMLKGIVGIEIAITRIEGKFKLSQNRDETDRRRVVAALARSPHAGDRELAEFMREQAPVPRAKARATEMAK